MRVIQDSDDEFDDDLQDEVLSPRTGDASRDHGKDASSLESGTGSTESLKRAFAEAHRDHLQSPSTHFAVPSQDEPQSSVSLPEHVSKKMKTLHDDAPHVSSPEKSSKKGPVTYGKERKPMSSSPSLHLVDTQARDISPAPLYDIALGLEGTMREGYMQHDSRALFPEPSSTIPNATLTQQRMLEGVVGPGMLGLDSEADVPPHQPPPEASVPWSDMMRFSSGEQSELSSQRAKDDAELESVQHFAEQNEEPPKSQRSRRGSSVRLRGSPLRNEVTLESIDPKDIMPPPQLTLPSQDFALPSTASGASQSDPQEKSRKSSSQAKNKAGLNAGSDEDLAFIGIPTEQYKPRPSRSRSLRATPDETIDFSVRPEKAAKGSKRRKTTNVAVTTSTAEYITTPEKVRQICDMGFTPTSTGRALKQNNGDVTVTVEWLITNGLGEDELASSNTPKRKPVSKRAKAVPATVVEPPPEAQIPPPPESVDDSKLTAGIETPGKPIATMDTCAPTCEINPTSAAQQRSPKVQVVIPMKSPNAKVASKQNPPEPPSKKAKRRKTTSDLPDSEATRNTTSIIEAAKEKKKGRGRPKKPANTVTSAALSQNVPEEPQLESENQADTALQTIEPNAMNLATSMPEEAKDQPLAPVVTSKELHASRTPEQTIKPSSRSPLSKGKTPYRVGLSKRARIAPLLRTLKK
ncbi:hypothetical protein HBI56_196650 [Parastagonospora nodorum]|nr:hypothetical protein HBH52_206870 [Parastagonospora nodorum]KAH4049989.1 hypothetical protein HBH49_140560 [Parastagonospora nodorum]KAH4075332.1 hypothetical protein HBH50_014760 [Parastagonospora nodorum]KAH4098366.1 hypothetical protein HBH48_032590 [Parastagonospora nodorum]KAH4230860.1 hypothetical protein HBI05_186840 [Parastagonospora nodorum]